MTRHFLVLVIFLFSLFLQHCSKPKSKGDHSPRGGDPTGDGKVDQEPSTDGGGGTETGGGSNVGNGGSGIVCRTGTSINRIELFDFYEAKILRGWEPNLAFTPDQSKTIFEQALDTAQFMVDTRWKSTDPVMATYLTERLKSLPSEVIFVDQPMPLQDDVAAVINAPTGCRREQIVIASEPHLAQKRYTVRKEYFEHPNFSNLDRAGLVLHELLYRLTSSNGATTSRGARYINAVLFADKQNETLTPLKHYFEVMKDAEFPWGGAHGVPIYLRGQYFFRNVNGDNDSHLERGYVVPGAPAETFFGVRKIACDTEFDANGKVYFTTSASEKEINANIPGIGLVTGHGSRFILPDSTYLDSHVGESAAWEIPFEIIEGACKKFNSSIIGSHVQNGVTTVQIPYIDVELPVHFNTLLYSVEAKVSGHMEFEWKDNEPAQYSGNGWGTLTFASGDKCFLSSAGDYSLARGYYGGLLERCAVRLVPGGSWLKFKGEFRSYIQTNDHEFYLDSFSDTEFIHAAGSDKVSLTLEAGAPVLFDNQGRLRLASLAKDALICSVFGGTRLFFAHTFLSFDENGCAREQG